MNKNRKIVILDFIINACLPILLGVFIYRCSFENYYSFIKNYIPDFLWAYAFVSAIFIIWIRVINKVWLAITLLFFVSYELLQYLHFVNGIGDVWDCIVYFVATIVALILNQFFKNFFYKNITSK